MPRGRATSPGARVAAIVGAVVALALGGVLAAAPDEAEAVSGPRATATVNRLAAYGHRAAGTVSERRGQALVARRLRRLGYRVGMHRVPLPRGGASRNVLGLSGGPIRVVVAAHLDGVPAGRAANDNASGVAALLEVAAGLADERGVLIVALGAEERVFTGARVHLGAARLTRALRRPPRLALSLDMVGVGGLTAVRGVAGSPSPTARAVLRQAGAMGLRRTYMGGSSASDHAEMTRAGWPAVWVQRRFDACWHRACDLPARVSGRALAETARLTLRVVRAELARG